MKLIKFDTTEKEDLHLPIPKSDNYCLPESSENKFSEKNNSTKEFSKNEDEEKISIFSKIGKIFSKENEYNSNENIDNEKNESDKINVNEEKKVLNQI